MTITKQCFICNVTQPLDNFYKHVGMADGHLNKCIPCTKQQECDRRDTKREHLSKYEQQRNADPIRRAKKLEYQKTHRQRYPERYKARYAVKNALRNGNLIKLGCEVCGKDAQAHHDDYSKPLEVRWLCFTHHREHHGQVVVVA